jgi:putative transposase
MLNQKSTAYKEEGTHVSCYDQIKQLPSLKEEYTFLKDVPSQALQQVIMDLDTAYKNFFRNNGSGYPKFKKKRNGGSFRIPCPCDIDFEKWTVKLPKTGVVRIFRGHYKPIKGVIKSYTIRKTPTGRYFISVLYETESKKPLNNCKSVGVDVGIKAFATLSTGEVFENQKYLKSNLNKLRALERSAARKYKKGKSRDEQSENWKRVMNQIAKLHEKIAFQRKDYLHKVSSKIASEYSTVCVETLNIKGMVQNHHLSQAISDCGWGMFIDMLSYKCDNLVKVDRYFASSQTCSECGYVNKEVKDLSIRKWVCPHCGTVHDRDVNAARNILAAGAKMTSEGGGLSPWDVTKAVASCESQNQESHGL